MFLVKRKSFEVTFTVTYQYNNKFLLPSTRRELYSVIYYNVQRKFKVDSIHSESINQSYSSNTRGRNKPKDAMRMNASDQTHPYSTGT